jgi:hypothetical protein
VFFNKEQKEKKTWFNISDSCSMSCLFSGLTLRLLHSPFFGG